MWMVRMYDPAGINLLGYLLLTLRTIFLYSVPSVTPFPESELAPRYFYRRFLIY